MTANREAEVREKTSAAPSRGRKRLAFVAAAAAIPVVLLLAAEGILRLAGYGGIPPVLVRVGRIENRTYVATDRKGVEAFFLRNTIATGTMEDQIFVEEKEAGDVRIAVIGESAARGYPQPRTLAASSFLEEMLARAAPARRVQVLNFGTVAVASHPLVQVTEEALAFAPDLVIVYAGNNEFYGASGVASVHSFGASTWALDAARFARRFAIVQWLGAVTSRAAAPAPDRPKTLMESVVADARIGPSDPRRWEAASRLETNLRRIVALCRERGVPVILSTLPANLRDLAPIGLDAPPAAKDAAGGEKGNDPAAAFAFGRERLGAGRAAEARAAFVRAKDLDPMPWRAPTESNEAVRRAAREGGAILADLEAAFFDAALPEGPGYDLLDDHVHPSLRGQALVASAWLRAMGEIGDERRDLRPSPAAVRSLPGWEEIAAALGRNPFDDYAVAHRVRSLFGAPFFEKSNPGAKARFDAICDGLLGAMSATEREAVARWRSPGTHGGGELRPITAVVAAALLAAGESPEKAADLFAIARRQVPRPSVPALEFGRGALLARRRVADLAIAEEGAALARELVREAETILALAPEGPLATVHAALGSAYHRLRRDAEAVRHLEIAAGIAPSPERESIAAELAEVRRLAADGR